MIPTDQKLDVCVTPAGGQFPQSPLFASAGKNCPSGVAYGQYTVALNVGPGKYDVKLVPQNSDCSAGGPSLTGVQVNDFPSTTTPSSTTIVAYGQDLAPGDAELVPLQDENSTSADIYVRFFNALNGGGTLNAGLVNRLRLRRSLHNLYSRMSLLDPLRLPDRLVILLLTSWVT